MSQKFKYQASFRVIRLIQVIKVALGILAVISLISLAIYPLAPISKAQVYRHSPIPFKGDSTAYGQYTLQGSGLDLIPAYQPVDRVLPRLAWVVVATTDAIHEYRDQIMMMSCWASKQGIPFYLEPTILISNKNFMTARHANTAKHLRNYQWVVVTDADFLPVDSSGKLVDWLDDTVDMIIQQRTDDMTAVEVCACMYFVKNSPGGWAFLRRWVAWADDGSRLNADNGDLQEILVSRARVKLIGRRTTKRCTQ